MERIIVSVAQKPFTCSFSSNLEAEPLVVQLVKEGEKWRLKLASPVVGLAGAYTTSSRYGDYYAGYVGAGSYMYERYSEDVPQIETRRWEGSHYLPEHFEHQSTANGYFATVGISALIKDLNLLQLKLQKLSSNSAHEAHALMAQYLKRVYWKGFSLGVNYGFKKTKRFFGLARLLAAPVVKHAVDRQGEKLALQPLAHRDYAKFLYNLYDYPPMECFHHYAGYKKWLYFWGCGALGILSVNRAHLYDEEAKRWYKLDPGALFFPLNLAFPIFYRKSYQRYKENGAICSGYPEYFFCGPDAGDEWRKAVGWFPDSVERKANGPLKKAPYVGHNQGQLPAIDLGFDEYRPAEY